MKPAKVFCIGGHKTGTTSMGEALAVLGFRVFPEPLWYGDPSLREDFYAGRYSRLIDLIDEYDTFEDSPFNHSDFYTWLHRNYSDAKFILTVRDTANVIGSYRRFFAKLDELVLEQDRVLKAYVKFFFQHEYGQAEPLDDEAQLGEIYEARNQAVTDFFRDKADQFLILDLEKEPCPWHRICAFLNEVVPSMKFPHMKRTK